MFYYILVLLIWRSFQKCMDHWKADKYFTDEVLEDSYCAEIITWRISNITADQYTINDAIAQSMYTELYETFVNETDPALDLNCLGIARFAFCAYAFPTCTNQQQQIHNVCDWLCDLWTVRCPNQVSFHNHICKQRDPHTCSYEKIFLIPIVILSLLLIF